MIGRSDPGYAPTRATPPIIGAETIAASLMYYGLLSVAIAGAFVARCRPRGMARAMFATALAQGSVGVIALSAGLGTEGSAWPLDVLGVANYLQRCGSCRPGCSGKRHAEGPNRVRNNSLDGEKDAPTLRPRQRRGGNLNALARVLALLFVVPATYLFVYWLPFSLIDVGEARWIVSAVSLVCAVAAGWFVWRGMASMARGAVTSMLLGAVLVGGIGFTAGFFGPMVFAPGANQGPLLGIFITGPLGFVVGAVGGLVKWGLRRDRSGVRESQF